MLETAWQGDILKQPWVKLTPQVKVCRLLGKVLLLFLLLLLSAPSLTLGMGPSVHTTTTPCDPRAWITHPPFDPYPMDRGMDHVIHVWVWVYDPSLMCLTAARWLQVGWRTAGCTYRRPQIPDPVLWDPLTPGRSSSRVGDIPGGSKKQNRAPAGRTTTDICCGLHLLSLSKSLRQPRKG